MQPYLDWLAVVKDVDKEPSPKLLVGLAKQLGVNPKELLVFHMSACDITLEDVLDK